jgi:uncharacterized membrane protein YeaQ/YmgE (transglycosylase-associated protein family)
MGWILAIILGGFAGWIASSLMGSAGGLLRNIVIGMLGAVLGNFILGAVTGTAPPGLIGQLIVAVAGAALLIWIGRALFRDR